MWTWRVEIRVPVEEDSTSTSLKRSTGRVVEEEGGALGCTPTPRLPLG